MIDRTIKNFRIKELIATGGMAAIYKAVQVSLDRMVAVKILHGHLAQDANFITRFEREAKAAANLKHENIVNIIEFGQADTLYFIAMEYVEGKSLKDVITSIRFIPHDIVLGISHQIIRGLEHAHKKGVVHRDIKPANILIGYDGIAKIADFGLAQAQDLTSVTITGSIVGTPAYMSPEQAGGRKVDARTDIFSLGVVIYEMITGIKPFNGETYSSVIHAILTVQPPKPMEANPLIPSDVSNIIERMLEKDPDKRYQTVAEVGDDISLYFKRRNREISCKDIGDFINTPLEQFSGLIEERKNKHFERGLHFKGLGKKKIDNAIDEFKKVLHLDPEDIQAKKHLAELEEKKKKAPIKEEKKPAHTAKKRTRIPLMPVGGITLIVVIAIFVFLMSKGYRKEIQPAEAAGSLHIKSQPESAKIYLDKKALALITPAEIDSLGVGSYMIEIKKSGYQTYTETIELKAGKMTSLDVVLEKEEIALKKDSIKVSKVIPTNPTTKGPTSVKKFAFIKISADPWARVYIDGKHEETTPFANPIKVLAGTHSIKLEHPECKVWKKNISFKPNETKTLNVTLEPLDGFLKLTVEPWAYVYIDGKFYDESPITKPIQLPAGRHTLKLTNPSYKQFEQVIEIPAKKMLKKHVKLQK